MWDDDARYAVIRGRDARYDGQFFTAVLTTGIYCRPSCPARTPARANVTFYRSAAAAQQAGFRSCRRCFPESVPGSPEWNAAGDAAARAMRLIDDGVVEREGVEGLAGRLGYSSRHLTRVLTDEVGAGPLALAVAHRLHHARALLETTALPVATVAHGAGFGSVRQFNDAARRAWGLTPTQVRGRVRAAEASPAGVTRVHLRLRYREPCDTRRTLAFLFARLIPGVEARDGDAYARAITLPHGAAVARLEPANGHVSATLDLEDPRDTAAAVARCRALLDLDADPVAIDDALATDALMAPLVHDAPGLRLPGALDPFEMIVRAIAGQQISVAGAVRALARIAERWGGEFTSAGITWRLFPDPEALVAVDPGVGILPQARWRTIHAVAVAILDGTLDVSPGADRAAARHVLLAIPGVGPWTADYVAMRAHRDPDAFPAGDLVLRKAVALDEPRLTVAARAWRPWRAYAAMHLWTATTEGRLP